MADGSELTAHYKYGFRDLTFGAGTDYITTKVDGLLSLPSVKANDRGRQFEHGVFPGSVLMGKRTITFDMTIVGQAGEDIERKLGAARRVFQPPRKRQAREGEPFTFWRPGEPKKFCLTRCTNRDFPSEFSTARGLAKGSVELQAPDPLIYSTIQNEATVTLAGTDTAGEVELFQAGDYVDGAWPIITIEGPTATPIISNAEDYGRAIRLDLALGTSDVAVIDVEQEIVWVNGIRRSTAIRSDSQWWALLPGYSTITYNRQGGSSASALTVHYRDVWQ